MSTDRSNAPVRSSSASARSDPFPRARGAVQPDVDLDRGGLRRLAHDGLDGQVRQAGRPVGDRLGGARGPGRGGVPPGRASTRAPGCPARRSSCCRPSARPPRTRRPATRARCRPRSAASPVPTPRRRRPRAPPRQAAWPASRQSSGPPGSTAASRRPSQVASSCSAYAAPTSAPVVPPASPSDRIGDADPTGSICSSCSPGPRTRRRSSRYASASPTGTASGKPAIRPPAPSRASAPAAPARAPVSRAPPSPVTANRQPVCRSRPRRTGSPGRVGSARCRPKPSGTAARSATSVRVRCRASCSAGVRSVPAASSASACSVSCAPSVSR